MLSPVKSRERDRVAIPQFEANVRSSLAFGSLRAPKPALAHSFAMIAIPHAVG
jgi:hypothetical protein